MPVSVRYIVNDVAAAIGFYSGTLGFKVDMNPAPGFAALSRGERIQIEVADIAAIVETLKASGVQFRSPIIQGNGGKQVLVNDPSGNPVELFEPKK